MRTPLLTGIIDRRILLNFRADPAVVNQLLPKPFRVHTTHTQAMVGICLIRLREERIKGLPGIFGLSSENGAHRFAVEWDEGGQLRTGVYIPRRDTSSKLNFLRGNQLLGIHHHSAFQVKEGAGRYAISLQSADGTHLAVEAQETDEWPATSVFPSLASASDFFRQGTAGYSPQPAGRGFSGVALRTECWQVSPLAVEQVASSYFSDETLFPAGSVSFDNALLMRNTPHDWQRLPSISTTTNP